MARRSALAKPASRLRGESLLPGPGDSFIDQADRGIQVLDRSRRHARKFGAAPAQKTELGKERINARDRAATMFPQFYQVFVTQFSGHGLGLQFLQSCLLLGIQPLP